MEHQGLEETDLTLRAFLGAQGAKKGDFSKVIEEAVRWRVFHRTVQDIRERNAGTGPDELQRIIDEAARPPLSISHRRRRVHMIVNAARTSAHATSKMIARPHVLT